MGSVRVDEAGPMTTVQDLGRIGHASAGVARCGGADALSLRVGNRLLGNDAGDASIEMTLTGGAFVFGSDAAICLTGASAPGSRIEAGSGKGGHDGRPLEGWKATIIKAGERVRIGNLEGGARAYLCVAGGVRTPIVLGSRSTHLASGLGEPGRALRDGDRLPIGDPAPGAQVAGLAGQQREQVEQQIRKRTLRVASGAQHGLFPREVKRAMERVAFRVDSRSDRAGVRLGITQEADWWNSAIGRRSGGEMVSEGVVPGCVQIAGDGLPIVLGVDGPTTGGYPVIACVIGADLPALGQCRPGDEVRFAWVTLEEARQAMREQEALIEAIGPMTRISGHYRAGRRDAPSDPFGGGRMHLLCDTGEAPPGPERERELAMLAYVSAASIACGGHAGDAASMREIVEAALRAGCLIGAHPSHPDREGFGRGKIVMPRDDLLASVRAQIMALRAVCEKAGAGIAFIKPHGALYHEVSSDAGLARDVAELARDACPGVALVGLAGSEAVRVWEEMGIVALGEGFVDRAYEADGSLRSRTLAGAVIDDPREAATRALRMARGGGVVASDGTVVPVRARVLCVHSDTPRAVEIARAARGAIDGAGKIGDSRD